MVVVVLVEEEDNEPEEEVKVLEERSWGSCRIERVVLSKMNGHRPNGIVLACAVFFALVVEVVFNHRRPEAFNTNS